MINLVCARINTMHKSKKNEMPIIFCIFVEKKMICGSIKHWAMLVIGANICVKPSGNQVRDAGVCLLENGILRVAIAEERITWKKHDNKIANSIHYCLDACGFSIDDVDLFVFSICGAKPLTKEYVHEYLLKEELAVAQDKIAICPSHHLSHASSAFFCIRFSR